MLDVQPFSDFESRTGCSLDAGLENRLNQLGRPNGERMGKLDDVDESHIPLPTLDAAHVVAM